MQIFVLTLRGAKERQNSIERQLKKYGFDFRFFFGIYGKDISEERKKVIFDGEKSFKAIGYEMSNNEIACAYGHYAIYDEIARTGIPEAIVIEDDAILNDDFPKVVRELQRKAPKGPVLVKLEKEKEFKKNLLRRIDLDETYSLFRPIQGVYLTTIYYLNLKAARLLVQDAFPVFVPSDFFAYTCRRVELLNINKTLAIQDETQPSVIGTRNKRTKSPDSLIQKLVRKTVLFVRFINPF